MFCNNCGVALSATAVSCVKCGHPVFCDSPTPSATIATSSLPYGWGRFYAGVQIAGGLFLLAFMLIFWNHLYPSTRRLMLTGVAVALPLGYGLWKRAKWGLYLLTIVFIVELGTLASRFSHGAVRPVPALVLHGIMLYYCWNRERDFV